MSDAVLEGKKRLGERLQAESDKKTPPEILKDKEEDVPDSDVPESVETGDTQANPSA
jgi:hypothetical protein